jgi:hypothetical protein
MNFILLYDVKHFSIMAIICCGRHDVMVTLLAQILCDVISFCRGR